jgi:membrane associated rhomboid family serine protease
MVILALLVAVYLPMTLVTGIFGMNIVEITRIENAPSRWTAVKAWGVVSGASVGCVLVYVIGRLLLKQKERLEEALRRQASVTWKMVFAAVGRSTKSHVSQWLNKMLLVKKKRSRTKAGDPEAQKTE